MRNPNGFGTVVKLSGTRRNPYAVRKTIGFNEKGYPIYKCIGYTATKADGLMLLAEYNRNPYDIDLHKITVEEVYKKWSERDFPKMPTNSAAVLRSAWKYLADIRSMRYCELKAYQMQKCIDDCPRGYSTKGNIKTLFYHLDRFALELDIVVKCNSTLLTVPPMPETRKHPFSENEIQSLWDVAVEPWVDSVLTLLYSGWRISELLALKCVDIDLDSASMTGGMKTKSGKNRIVPIHPKIMPFILNRYSPQNEYLFEYNGKQCSLNQYYTFWNGLMQSLDMSHTPHECRHTFRSRLDRAGANKVCIDLLMGHKSKDVGERVYTHKTIEELTNTILLLK